MPDTNSGFDIAVIGGGASGLGAALESAGRGYRVAVLEKETCFHATSAGSLRIIHGGLRYLQSLNFKRVIESLAEQNYWLREAPGIVQPLRCFLPLRKTGLKSRWPLFAASRMYEFVSRVITGRANGSRIVDPTYVEAHVPALRGLVPYGALLWQDALLNDLESFRDLLKAQAAAAGVVIRENATVKAVNRNGSEMTVAFTGTDGESRITARVVVNTSGPWMSSVGPAGSSRLTPRGWCKAFNVIINRQLDPAAAFGLTCHSGQILFFVPRGEATAIGTWYVPFQGNPDKADVTGEELDEFLKACTSAYPLVPIKSSDVMHVETGILPMHHVGPRGPVLYGSHRIKESFPGFIDVMSTKLTTLRSQGRAVIKAAAPYL